MAQDHRSAEGSAGRRTTRTEVEMIDHGGSPKRIGSRAAAASAAVRWRPWLLLLGLALAGGPALPQVATAGSLPVTRDGKASWDSHEATPAQNGGSDGRAPRGGESTSGLHVADERAGRHAGGRGQPTSHELDGRGVPDVAAEGAAAPPTAIPDQPTVLTERRDPSERSPAGRTGRRSQEPGSAVEQGSPDRRRPSGDDDRSYGTVPPQPESVSAPLTARNNLNGPPEGSRDRSRPSRHSGSPDARRSQRDVPRQAAPVPSPDDPGAVRVGRDDVTRSGPPDAPSDGQVGTSASAVSHNAQLQLSAPGARDARQPDSGTVAASRPAVSRTRRGGRGYETRRPAISDRARDERAAANLGEDGRRAPAVERDHAARAPLPGAGDRSVLGHCPRDAGRGCRPQ